jgi:CheY-like chemotaxis protein
MALRAHVLRETILVVEDEHDIRVCLRDALENEGYVVLSAANGISAQEVLTRIHPPDLILLDWMMPLMGGEEFMAFLRSDPVLSQVPVVVMSAFPEKAIPYGIGRFLKKPLDIENLLNVVSKSCTRRKLE